MVLLNDLETRLKRDPARWLVTGVAGFIGSNLLQRLLMLGQEVVGVDNFSTGRLENLEEVRRLVGPTLWSRFELIRGDICDSAVCAQACEGVRVTLHQAALGSVPLSIDDPLAAHEANLTGFLRVLLASRTAGVQTFVYAASSAVYGDNAESPKVERHAGVLLSPYAVTKLANELYAQVFSALHGMRTVGLRYFNVFGPRQDPHGAYAAVIPAWFATLIQGERPRIHGDGETTRDFCYVDNVVAANLLASSCSNVAAAGQVYNIACGRSTSLNELFWWIREAVAQRFPEAASLTPEHGPFRPGDVRHSLACVDKARVLLGFNPSVDVAEGLNRTAAWYMDRLAAHV